MDQKRIDRAWGKCKNWITEFDGSATETYLAGVPIDSLPQAFDALAKQSSNLRVSTISGQNQEQGQFVSPESILQNVALLSKHEIADLSINLTARPADFDVDLHMIVDSVEDKQVGLEIVWWSDQVFDDNDPYKRFQALIEYFISLQMLFQARGLFVSPETVEPPGPGTSWVEV